MSKEYDCIIKERLNGGFYFQVFEVFESCREAVKAAEDHIAALNKLDKKKAAKEKVEFEQDYNYGGPDW
jgi:hypothetical protein